MIKKGDNKIAIPWYRRPVNGVKQLDDMGNNPISFNLPNVPNPNLRPRTQLDPVRVPVTSPVPDPNTAPITDTELEPFPVPIPKPDKNPYRKPTTQPKLPQLPAFPAWATNPDFDWKQIAPIIEPKKNLMEKTLESILKPVVYIIAGNEIKNQYIKVTISDPVYNKMLKDPVLGSVLREAEKANLDAEQVGTILANFDWKNGDIKDLEKSLIASIGVAGAARLMVFIIGRKVVFKI